MKKYEKVKIIKNQLKLVFVKLNNNIGFYTFKQITEFEECRLTVPQLSKRIKMLCDNKGELFTLNSVIMNYTKSDKKNTEHYQKYLKRLEMIRNKELEENNKFNNFMKLINIGTMHKESLIMQCKMYK